MQMLEKIWRYRGFIGHSVQQEFRARYAGSALGLGWAVVNPLMQILVYTLVFSQVMRARMPGQADDVLGYSVYLCSGLIPWTLFAEIVSRSSTQFVDNGNLIKKSAFPRLCLPIIVLLSSLVHFALLMGLFLVFLLAAGRLDATMLLVGVPLALVLALAGVGLGLLLGTLNVFFRDVSQMQTIVLQFWFWLTPIVWVAQAIPPAARPLLALNPVAPLIEAQHAVFAGTGVPTLAVVAQGLLFAGVCVGLGYVVFRHKAAEFADEL